MTKDKKHAFLDNACLLLICHDAQMDDFKERLLSLYDPLVDTVWVRVDERLNFIKRARMLKQVRSAFKPSDIRIQNITTAQVRFLAFYIRFYAQLS